MSNTSDMSVYEMTFAPSDKTDAILVVDGKKLHVNKTILSYHSDYFNSLFNSDFAEKSMQKIPIKDVKLEEFATLLSLVHKKPILPTVWNAEKLLQLADQFLLPAAKSQVQIFICTIAMDQYEKLRLADEYNLDHLLEHTVENSFKDKEDLRDLFCSGYDYSDRVHSKLFMRLRLLYLEEVIEFK